MTLYYNHDGNLCIENIGLEELAKIYGTPCYLYSKAAIIENWQAFTENLQGFAYQIAYAVKANSNIAILQLLANLGAGFDIVSEGELARVIKAGGDRKKIVFSGVGKSCRELEKAIALDIFCIDIESKAELQRLKQIANHLNKKVNIALRVNPNIDANTHRYIATGLKENKFGIELNQVIHFAEEIASSPQLELIGIACHIGSQITDLHPFNKAIDSLINLYLQLKNKGMVLKYINLGGGLGITYEKAAPSIKDYIAVIKNKLAAFGLTVIIEPGRALIGKAGCLLTRIEYLKESSEKNFAIVDTAMNDLLRPALYHAYQPILAVKKKDKFAKTYDIVGPVCESADFLGKNRKLAIESGDLLAIDLVGAYGFSMASNYNSRPRPAEVLITSDKSYLIRRRETIEELFAAESLC